MTLTTRSLFGRSALLVAMVATLLVTSAGYAADLPSEDPAAQAATFEKQAADLRARADRHEKLAKKHRAGAGPSKLQHESIANHCERIAANLRAAADESEALAASYRDITQKR